MGREGLPPQVDMGMLISTSLSFGKLSNILYLHDQKVKGYIGKRKDVFLIAR